MNPELMKAVAQARDAELLLTARRTRRAAELRARPQFATRLIQSILAASPDRRPVTELPPVKPVETDA